MSESTKEHGIAEHGGKLGWPEIAEIGEGRIFDV